MADEWVAVVGLRYPDGDDEYDKAAKGRECKWQVVEPGDVCKNITERSVVAYLAHGREVIRKKGAKA